MPQRMFIRRVRQRPHDGPEMTPFCQPRQVLRNFQTGRLSCNRRKLAAHFCRSIGLRIKTLVLGQATGKENIDAGFSGPGETGSRVGRSKSRQMIASQSKQADGSGLNSSPARNARMRQLWKLIEAHQFIPLYREIAFRKLLRSPATRTIGKTTHALPNDMVPS